MRRRFVQLIWVATSACQTVGSSESFTVPNRYWLASETDSLAVAAALVQVRSSVAEAFGGGLLESGYPRSCGVTRPPPSPGPTYPECLEDAEPHDGLRLGPEGHFLQFVTLDYPSPRVFVFEVYLVPFPDRASHLTPRELSEYPRIAVPPFPLSQATYRQWLSAVSQGIEAAGGVPF